MKRWRGIHLCRRSVKIVMRIVRMRLYKAKVSLGRGDELVAGTRVAYGPQAASSRL